MKHYGRLLALRTVRDLYVAAAVVLLEGHGWLSRRRSL